MAHNIEGFIAAQPSLREASQALGNAYVVPLGHGFAFLPVDAAFAGDATPNDGPPSIYPYFDNLSAKADEFARALSRETPVAYVLTDYFGGAGAQASIVWRDGDVVLGPLKTRDQDPPDEGAINTALRLLGVTRGSEYDEFDTIHLGRYRTNQDFRDEIESPS